MCTITKTLPNQAFKMLLFFYQEHRQQSFILSSHNFISILGINCTNKCRVNQQPLLTLFLERSDYIVNSCKDKKNVLGYVQKY